MLPVILASKQVGKRQDLTVSYPSVICCDDLDSLIFVGMTEKMYYQRKTLYVRAFINVFTLSVFILFYLSACLLTLFLLRNALSSGYQVTFC